jgi:hypothetical protein
MQLSLSLCRRCQRAAPRLSVAKSPIETEIPHRQQLKGNDSTAWAQFWAQRECRRTGHNRAEAANLLCEKC